MKRAVLLVALVPAARGDLQEPLEQGPPLAEGALSNDCFLPVSDPAGAAFAEGDSALVRSRAARDTARAEEAQRLLAEALDGWHRAIELAEAGASVWFDPAKDGPRRLSEGARHALLRRISSLSDAERAVWAERFDPGRDRLLEATGRAEELAELERTAPATASAARAALLLCDAALETGDPLSAAGHLARAALHAELSRAQELRDAFERRRSHIETAWPASPAAAWETATELTLAGQASLAGPAGTNLRPGSSRPRDRNGIAFLSERRIAVQTSELVHIVELGPEGTLEPRTVFRPGDLLGGLGPGPVRDATPRPLVPAASRGRLVLVHGVSSGEEPNALLCLEPPEELGRAFLEDRLAPRLAWAIVGDQRLEPSGDLRELPDLSELSALEFQPGPLIVGERVIVQGREYPGDVRAWLIAFGLEDGELLWKRRIASGADLRPERRFDTDKRLWSQPLVLLDGALVPRVFAGTNLGAGALFDVLDGEPCWTLKNRRRDPHEDGWLGARPARAASDPTTLLWTPNDSDRLYALRMEPVRAGDRETGSLFLAPPAPRAQAERCLGGDLQEVLVLGSRDGVRTVGTRRMGLDPIEAVHLSSIESFAGDGLVSRARVLVPTDRKIYLFDRGRELYLLDHERLPQLGRSADPIPGTPPSVDLIGNGRFVLAVGDEALWAFRAD